MPIALGADGYVEVGTLPADACCPPDPCNVTVCDLMCSFVALLPNGPLWDRPKTDAMRKFDIEDCDAAACFECSESSCGTMINYAMYTGRRLYDLIGRALLPALRESSPETALFTLDSWLERLGWVDCFATACRDPMLGPSPFEIEGECGPVYVPPNIPDRLNRAVKRAIALALKRLIMYPRRNLAGINWVLEPLGILIRPYIVPCTIDDVEYEECPLICCDGARFEVCPVASGLIDFYSGSDCRGSTIQIPGSYVDPITGITIWPALFAAQCIAFSMLPDTACAKVPPIVRCA